MIDTTTRTHQLIPGGAHTYSKGDDQFPINAPRYLESGSGAWVWDDQGNRFLDWSMGLRTMTLGYGYEEVDNAAIAQIKKGLNFGRPSYIETEFAEDFTDLIPSAEMVKFAKNGSTVTTAALKIARAYTGRPYIAFCKDHPFFSYDDWFIGTTPCNNGIPEHAADYSLSFNYNDIESLKSLFTQYPGQIAAVMLEPCTVTAPENEFLQQLQALCQQQGTVFILDEMITGFRWHLQGAHTYFGVTPDLSTYGKGIANGYSVSVLAGKRELMQLGGLEHSKQRMFLISTTHGAENSGLAAARACLKVYRENPVIDTIWTTGEMLITGMNNIAQEMGLSDFFSVSGYPCRPEYCCRDQHKNVSLAYRTLFAQEMIKSKVLIPYIVPSYSHRDNEIEYTLEAVCKALEVYKQALENGIENYLQGPEIKPVFRARN
jgi:glutamate-1-semialdehyde 2,1-aminomutase